MITPRVSVICSFLNEERFLAEAIDSVLVQEFQQFELILIDDGSVDGSTAIARDFAARFSPKIRYLEHPGHRNRGTSASRNLGLRYARGELIVFTDGDDVWRPSRLSEQVGILDDHPDVGMVCGTANYWRSWNGGKDKLVPTGHLVDAATFPPETTLSLYPLGGSPAPCDPMIRRSVIEKVGGWEERFGGLYDDIAFHAKIYLECGVWLSSKVWYDYRIHSASCTATRTPAQYRTVRRRFLVWFESYLAKREFAGDDRIRRALVREIWRLDHRIVAGLLRRAEWLARLTLPKHRLRGSGRQEFPADA